MARTKSLSDSPVNNSSEDESDENYDEIELRLTQSANKVFNSNMDDFLKVQRTSSYLQIADDFQMRNMSLGSRNFDLKHS